MTRVPTTRLSPATSTTSSSDGDDWRAPPRRLPRRRRGPLLRRRRGTRTRPQPPHRNRESRLPRLPRHRPMPHRRPATQRRLGRPRRHRPLRHEPTQPLPPPRQPRQRRMTGHDVTTRRADARYIEAAILGILHACLTARAPGRTTCPDCRALIAHGIPCPICIEVRRRQYERLHRKTA